MSKSKAEKDDRGPPVYRVLVCKDNTLTSLTCAFGRQQADKYRRALERDGVNDARGASKHLERCHLEADATRAFHKAVHEGAQFVRVYHYGFQHRGFRQGERALQALLVHGKLPERYTDLS